MGLWHAIRIGYIKLEIKIEAEDLESNMGVKTGTYLLINRSKGLTRIG